MAAAEPARCDGLHRGPTPGLGGAADLHFHINGLGDARKALAAGRRSYTPEFLSSTGSKMRSFPNCWAIDCVRVRAFPAGEQPLG